MLANSFPPDPCQFDSDCAQRAPSDRNRDSDSDSEGSLHGSLSGGPRRAGKDSEEALELVELPRKVDRDSAVGIGASDASYGGGEAGEPQEREGRPSSTRFAFGGTTERDSFARDEALVARQADIVRRVRGDGYPALHYEARKLVCEATVFMRCPTKLLSGVTHRRLLLYEDVIVFAREEFDTLVYEKDYKLATVSIKNAPSSDANTSERPRWSRHLQSPRELELNRCEPPSYKSSGSRVQNKCPFLSYLAFFSRHAQAPVLQAPVLARGAV